MSDMFGSFEEARDWVKNANDNRHLIKFEWKAFDLNWKDPKQDPKWEDRVWYEERLKGDSKTVNTGWINDRIIEKYADQYDKFIAGQEQEIEGTPLDAWPSIRPAQIKALNGQNMLSVEDLAGARDGVITKVPFGRELQKKARLFLDHKSGVDPEKEAMKQQLAAQTEVLAKLQADIKAMQKPKAKPKPAPKKAETDEPT